MGKVMDTESGDFVSHPVFVLAALLASVMFCEL